MNKILKRCIIVCACIVLLAGIFFMVDKKKVKYGENPIFCFKLAKLKDGGTVRYIGLGYKVVYFHKMEGNGFYEGIHMCSIFKSTEKLYEEKRSNVSAFLANQDDEKMYNILKEFVDEKTLEELAKNILSEERQIDKDFYGDVESERTEEGGTILTLGPTNVLEETKKPIADSRIEWMKLCVSNFSNIKNEQNKEYIKSQIEKFYNENKNEIKNLTLVKNMEDILK